MKRVTNNKSEILPDDLKIAIEKWAKKVADDHGFREVGHTAEIFGICKKC
jgi:Fe2+ or Zn2+ uptake regulation protein